MIQMIRQRFHAVVIHLRCWWFGCIQHDQDPSPPDEAHCIFCDELVSYFDMVGDTRHLRFIDTLHQFSPRRIWPRR